MKKILLSLSMVAMCILSACNGAKNESKNDTVDSTAADTVVAESAKIGTESFTANGVTFEMVKVEGGTFMMGADKGDSLADPDEFPQHEVSISTFYMGQCVVTQKLWKAVMGTAPSKFAGDNKPVERVSWLSANEFIKKLNEMTGKTFRLPTEAEWEFASRGGVKSKGFIYAGSNNSDEVGWCENNLDEETKDVAMKAPNELGLYDMSGNIGEWCSDIYDAKYYANSPKEDPQGPAEGPYRCLRGNGWCSNECRYIRSANRSGNIPEYEYPFVGFRLAMSEAK